jgi:hypothetical protein
MPNEEETRMREAYRPHTELGKVTECPQAHGCLRCGRALNEHVTIECKCPERSTSFFPDTETLKRFPEQYPAWTSMKETEEHQNA